MGFARNLKLLSNCQRFLRQADFVDFLIYQRIGISLDSIDNSICSMTLILAFEYNIYFCTLYFYPYLIMQKYKS